MQKLNELLDNDEIEFEVSSFYDGVGSHGLQFNPEKNLFFCVLDGDVEVKAKTIEELKNKIEDIIDYPYLDVPENIYVEVRIDEDKESLKRLNSFREKHPTWDDQAEQSWYEEFNFDDFEYEVFGDINVDIYTEYSDFEEFAEEHLPEECRAKSVWMDPNDAGKGNISPGWDYEGTCDLLWVCQEDCSEYDFETLMKCFGAYYKEETNGKTYSAVMKSRNFPGAGNFIRRQVSFENGKPTITVDDEEKLVCSNDIKLLIDYDEDEDSFSFKLECSEEDITSYGKTIKEVKEEFVNELDDLNEFVQVDAGYEVSHNEVDLEYKDDNYSIDDCIKEVWEPMTDEEKEEWWDKYFDYDQEPLAEGEYRTYEQIDLGY